MDTCLVADEKSLDTCVDTSLPVDTGLETCIVIAFDTPLVALVDTSVDTSPTVDTLVETSADTTVPEVWELTSSPDCSVALANDTVTRVLDVDVNEVPLKPPSGWAISGGETFPKTEAGAGTEAGTWLVGAEDGNSWDVNSDVDVIESGVDNSARELTVVRMSTFNTGVAVVTTCARSRGLSHLEPSTYTSCAYTPQPFIRGGRL